MPLGWGEGGAQETGEEPDREGILWRMRREFLALWGVVGVALEQATVLLPCNSPVLGFSISSHTRQSTVV